MRAAVAQAPVRSASVFPPDAAGRLLCAGVAPGRGREARNDANGCRLAELSASLYSLAPPVVAQQRVAQEKSMVRRRARAVSEEAYAAGAEGMRRRFSVFVLAIALASCAPVTAPRGLENDTPAILPDAFLTRDGLRLPLRRWEAPNPRAVIVALHGMSDYSNAFDMP